MRDQRNIKLLFLVGVDLAQHDRAIGNELVISSAEALEQIGGLGATHPKDSPIFVDRWLLAMPEAGAQNILHTVLRQAVVEQGPNADDSPRRIERAYLRREVWPDDLIQSVTEVVGRPSHDFHAITLSSRFGLTVSSAGDDHRRSGVWVGRAGKGDGSQLDGSAKRTTGSAKSPSPS